MKFFSVFGDLNINITDSFLKKVTDLVGLYVLIWLIIEVIVLLILGFVELYELIIYVVKFSFDPAFGITPPSSANIINLMPLINGFTLFTFFPNWLRIILMTYIFVAVINIPITIFLYISFSSKYSGSEYTSRKELKIHCIECKNKIGVPGSWLNGEIDIRCAKCGALMTLTLEDGEFKRLTLKQATKYSIDYLSRL